MGRRRWAWIRRKVFSRDGYRCVQCGRHGRLECDHIVSVDEGGDDSLVNLRTLCRACHIEATRARWRMHDVSGQREWERALLGPQPKAF